MQFAVWGNGQSASSLIRDAEYTEEAYQTAIKADPYFIEHIGDQEFPADQCWFVQVDCDESLLDQITRLDKSTRAFAPIKAEGRE